MNKELRALYIWVLKDKDVANVKINIDKYFYCINVINYYGYSNGMLFLDFI